MPTTWRTCGAACSATWPAPHATSRTIMSGSSGSSHAKGEWGRRANGECSPPKIAACFSNDERTTASCSCELTTGLSELRDDALAEELDRPHDLLVGNLVPVHEAQQQVAA